ncbi:hypothetical protein NDU88_001305 [Pleurodeles waltl]|uniref:Uncharacterized protein n=1 Tax=Pleurodeles waltl TaxID=8319 RepID=A0AAV7Q5M9_PLEWA|nr:hypothetical protein NDU88_001305 [Pleurodeles waltl]
MKNASGERKSEDHQVSAGGKEGGLPDPTRKRCGPELNGDPESSERRPKPRTPNPNMAPIRWCASVSRHRRDNESLGGE